MQIYHRQWEPRDHGSKSTSKSSEIICWATSKPLNSYWINKGSSIKITEISHVPISIRKFYQDSITCDVVDMDVCQILLERPWQYKVHATHKDRHNIYMFLWNGKKIAMRPIGNQTETFKLEGWSFLSMCSRGEFSTEFKETK